MAGLRSRGVQVQIAARSEAQPMIKDAADVQCYSSARTRLSHNELSKQTATDEDQTPLGQVTKIIDGGIKDRRKRPIIATQGKKGSCHPIRWKQNVARRFQAEPRVHPIRKLRVA